MVRVKLIGAGGYGGIGLVELLRRHPDARLVTLVDVDGVGKRLSDLWPYLDGYCDEVIVAPDSEAARSSEADVTFCATPDGVGQGAAPGELTPSSEACAKGGCKFACSKGQACDYDCTGGGCDVTCKAGSQCAVACGGPGKCRLFCESDATCKVRCDGPGCDSKCNSGSKCRVACPGGKCTTQCADGAKCNVNCSGGGCKTPCADGAACNILCSEGCS